MTRREQERMERMAASMMSWKVHHIATLNLG